MVEGGAQRKSRVGRPKSHSHRRVHHKRVGTHKRVHRHVGRPVKHVRHVGGGHVRKHRASHGRKGDLKLKTLVQIKKLARSHGIALSRHGKVHKKSTLIRALSGTKHRRVHRVHRARM